MDRSIEVRVEVVVVTRGGGKHTRWYRYDDD